MKIFAALLLISMSACNEGNPDSTFFNHRTVHVAYRDGTEEDLMAAGEPSMRGSDMVDMNGEVVATDVRNFTVIDTLEN